MADYSGGSGQMARERPPQASRDGQKDGRLARIALIVGILAALATVVGVAWTIFNRENTEVADYQNQVSATCEQVRTVLAAEHNEVLVLGPGGIRVRKDLLLAVMRNNLDQARIAFDALNAKTVPAALGAQHQESVDAQTAWFAAFDQVIATIQERLRNNAPIERLQELGVEFSGSQGATTRLTTAMTALAGRNCPVTGPAPSTTS
jgi:type VI protein secretion system component VasK